MSTCAAAWPRLSTWSLTWRYALAITAWLLFFLVGTDHSRPGWLVAVDAVVGLAMIALIRLRRRWPVTVAVVYLVMSVVAMSGLFAAVWAYISLCTHRRWRQIVPVTVLSLAAQAVNYAISGQASPMTTTTGAPIPSWLHLPLVLGTGAVFTVAYLALGLYIGAQRDLYAALNARAESAEREQELRVGKIQADERNRIAREMHDVVAHRISLVSLNAGALAYRDDLSPQQVRTAAAAIQDNAHEALEELRSVLGQLRNASDGVVYKPQPTLADLPALLADVAPQQVRLVDDAAGLDRLPARVSRTAYRVVQEGLTNARKHAFGATVELRLSGEPEQGLCVELANLLRVGPTVVPGAGQGLVGLTERVESVGGSLTARADQGVFEMKVWLPWPSR